MEIFALIVILLLLVPCFLCLGGDEKRIKARIEKLERENREMASEVARLRYLNLGGRR